MPSRMPSDQGGYVFVVPGGSRGEDVLRDRLAESGRFTDVLDQFDRRPPTRCLSLLVDESGVFAAAVMESRDKVATFKRRVLFSNVVEFEPIAISELKADVPTRLRKSLTLQLVTSGAFSPATWQFLWTSLKTKRPTVGADFQRLEQRVNARPVSFAQPGAKAIVEERDAVGLALKVFGTDPLPIYQAEAAATAAPVGFLQSLSEINLPEDLGIMHDAQVIDGWESLTDSVIGTKSFRSGGRTLDVMNVNRTRVERVLGVDLLYFDRSDDGFVFVQYKVMSDRAADGQPAFRPRGKSYHRELTAMSDAWDKLAVLPVPPTMSNFRMLGNPFFFKLYSPRVSTAARTDRLIPGMYLPLDYWKLLMSSPSTTGPKGGRLITWQNVDRHLNSTLFVELLRGGWLGCRGAQTEQLLELVHAAVDAHHSVIVAVEN